MIHCDLNEVCVCVCVRVFKGIHLMLELFTGFHFNFVCMFAPLTLFYKIDFSLCLSPSLVRNTLYPNKSIFNAYYLLCGKLIKNQTIGLNTTSNQLNTFFMKPTELLDAYNIKRHAIIKMVFFH